MACGDGGELLLCNLCPASYHLECIGAHQVRLSVMNYLFLSLNARAFSCRFQLVVGRAPTTFAVSARKRPKIAATVSSGSSSQLVSCARHISRAVMLSRIKFNCFFSDARCVRVHSAKTANPTTCHSCPSTTAVSPKGYGF
jgi:hypothetical protein